MVDPPILDPIDYFLKEMVYIDELHFNYLSAHENQQKLEEKKRLEGHIREYLMIAPHDKKFFYPETRHILHTSVEKMKENFNGCRAAAAWTSIAAYAHNLLAQSWRKEYREIKTYSGFYKHNIESGLVGSELMLHLMGYRETDEGTYILEGPVDPDKVTYVSRDSHVALVECQILSTIYAELLKSGCRFSWLEILQYREAHPCTIELALNGLMYQYNQRCLSARRLDCYPKCNMVDYSYQPPYCTPHNMPSHYYATPEPMPMLNPYGSSVSKCTTCHPDYASAPLLRPNVGYSVPTAQLIEVDVPYTRESYVYDTDNQKKTIDKLDSFSGTPSTNDSNSNLVKSMYTNEAGWATWGGAKYQPPETKPSSKYELLPDQRLVQIDWEEKFKPLQIDDSKPSCSTCEPQPFENPPEKIFKKKIKHESINPGPSSSQTLAREVPKKPDFGYTPLKVKLSDKWECPTCTYHNTNDKDVCEMCSKSKTSGNEVQPLVSGGRQCPKCTLVNEKGVTKCEACETNLKDSPTYI